MFKIDEIKVGDIVVLNDEKGEFIITNKVGNMIMAQSEKGKQNNVIIGPENIKGIITNIF